MVGSLEPDKAGVGSVVIYISYYTYPIYTPLGKIGGYYMGRMVTTVSFPSDVAEWIDSHWEKGTVSANLVDLVRITMKGASGKLPARNPDDYSRVPFTERISMGVATAKPFLEQFQGGHLSQPQFLEAIESIARKLNLVPRDILSALPGYRSVKP